MPCQQQSPTCSGHSVNCKWLIEYWTIWELITLIWLSGGVYIVLAGKGVGGIVCFDLDSSLIAATAGLLFNINLAWYTLKWTVMVWLHELSRCVHGWGKSCLVTMATNREDLVWAATLHCPCYDSADVVEKTMNSHGECWEQTGVQESVWVAYIWEMHASLSVRWDKAGLKSGDLLSVWRGLTGTALIRQTEF